MNTFSTIQLPKNKSAGPGRAQKKHSPFFSPILQPKLTVNPPGDTYEQEADAVAEKVMRMPDAKAGISVNQAGALPITPIQRKCSACEEEEIQMKGADSHAGAAEPTTAVHNVIRSSGQPLDTGTRTFMESRIGYDFGSVRIHNDALAHQSSADINALAYTTGNHIAFGEGKYQPHSNTGKQLLAHELTHVVQQGGKSQSLQRMLQVNKGVTEIKKIGTLAKGEVFYSGGTIDKSDLEKEIITSLMKSGRVFKIKGKKNSSANTNFDAHIKARIGVVDFAGKKKYSFPEEKKKPVRANPDFWELDPVTKELIVKKGVDRQKAIDDLNVNPKMYTIACGDATALTVEGGGKSLPFKDEASGEDDWVPGDHGYIKNTKFRAGQSTAIMGENIIYTGNDKFWGHFSDKLEYKTLKGWRAEVKGWTVGEEGGEELSDQRGFPGAGLE